MADPRSIIRPDLDPMFMDKFFQSQTNSIMQEWPSLSFAVPQNKDELQEYYAQAENDPNNKRNLFTQGAHKISDDVKAWAIAHNIPRIENVEKFKQNFDFSQELDWMVHSLPLF